MQKVKNEKSIRREKLGKRENKKSNPFSRGEIYSICPKNKITLRKSNKITSHSKLHDIRKSMNEVNKHISSLNKMALYASFYKKTQDQIVESPFIKEHAQKTEKLLNTSSFNKDKENKEMENINKITEQQYYNKLDVEEKRFYDGLSREEKDWYLEMGTTKTGQEFVEGIGNNIQKMDSNIKNLKDFNSKYNFLNR